MDPAREGRVTEGLLPAPLVRSLDAALAVLGDPGVSPETRAGAYALLHSVQLRINRRLRPVRDELVAHMVREDLRAMGALVLRTSAIDPAWPANDPTNWEDAMVQDALEALRNDPATRPYVRVVPFHLEVDTAALGADVHAGIGAARALYSEANAKGWRTEAGRRVTVEVRTPSGVTI